MNLQGNPVGPAVMLVAAMSTTGCGWILGLDEFTDQPPPSPDGGVPVECTSPEDCPAGQHGTAACEAGTCTFSCEVGFANCDDAVGCETSISADKNNCGGCGLKCSAYCVESTCNDPADVDAMTSHTCAILKDGSLWCWGGNNFGQLGDGTTVDRLSPTRVMLSGPAVQVAGTGGFESTHTCALLADRTVACWGQNQTGQLGDGTTDPSTVPVPVLLSGVRQIATNGGGTCAVTTDDVLFCWGDMVPGFSSLPVQVAVSVSAVAMGGNHACLITIDGILQCWGWNGSGQLGLGPQSNQSEPEPVAVTAVTDVVEVACGGMHTCARNGVGLYCWGDSTYGQLGLGDTVSHDVPQPLDLPSVEFVALGGHHSSAIIGGELYMWGANSTGELGDGTAVDALSPENIGLTGVKMTSLGEPRVVAQHSCALTDAGVLLCWGENSAGQLGDGTTVSKSVPTPVVWP